MADKSSQLVLSALTRAAAEAAGVPLHGSKSQPGLFPTTAIGKQAAQRCCDDGLLVAADPARAPVAGYTISDKGMTFLLRQLSPREVLEDFVRVVEAREGQVRQLLASAREMQQSLAGLREHGAAVLDRLQNGGDLKALCRAFHQEAEAGAPAAEAADPRPALLAALRARASGPSSEDYPLPALYRQVQGGAPLSLGAFHDALRDLVHAGQVYLHPWTGPLYEIPEPPFALLIGHEIAYYASLREGGR